MLEMVTDGARVIENSIKRGLASPMGIFAYAAVSGIFGVIILMAFFSMLLSTATLAKILPFFIAFNAAASAYGIVDKGGPDFPRLTFSLVLISVLFAGTEVVFISFFLPWEAVTAWMHVLVGGLTALFFSLLGAKLAKQNRHMKKRSQS